MVISFPILQMNTDLLKKKAGMLEEYFGIHIDDQGNISRLPVILDQYTPDMDRIPEFVLSLGNDVSYKTLHSPSLNLSNFFFIFSPVHVWLTGNKSAIYMMPELELGYGPQL